MATAEAKNFDSPDEVRPFEGNGQAKVVELSGHTIGLGTFEPGWSWAENVRPIAGTDSCQVPHLAYVLSGHMVVHMDGGNDLEIGPGDVASIPPGHHAEVTGDEACVMVDFGDVSKYAKRD
jgi:uncharacterized cupin superfamily protein